MCIHNDGTAWNLLIHCAGDTQILILHVKKKLRTAVHCEVGLNLCICKAPTLVSSMEPSQLYNPNRLFENTSEIINFVWLVQVGFFYLCWVCSLLHLVKKRGETPII